jgi:hypothetical protein
MDTSKLKTYAPKARRDFISAVTRRAAKLGITAKGVSPNREEGQLVFIEGSPTRSRSAPSATSSRSGSLNRASSRSWRLPPTVGAGGGAQCDGV